MYRVILVHGDSSCADDVRFFFSIVALEHARTYARPACILADTLQLSEHFHTYLPLPEEFFRWRVSVIDPHQVQTLFRLLLSQTELGGHAWNKPENLVDIYLLVAKYKHQEEIVQKFSGYLQYGGIRLFVLTRFTLRRFRSLSEYTPALCVNFKHAEIKLRGPIVSKHLRHGQVLWQRVQQHIPVFVLLQNLYFPTDLLGLIMEYVKPFFPFDRPPPC